MILVIGYGNLLRSDDGVGQHVAREIEAQHWRNVTSLAVHQLTPELATVIRDASHVFFVDARLDHAGGVQSVPLEPSTELSSGAGAHASSPADLLALTKALFGRCPPATLIAVPVETFAIGDCLSERALEGAAMAIRLITARLTADGSPSRPESA